MSETKSRRAAALVVCVEPKASLVGWYFLLFGQKELVAVDFFLKFKTKAEKEQQEKVTSQETYL